MVRFRGIICLIRGQYSMAHALAARPDRAVGRLAAVGAGGVNDILDLI